MEGSAPLRNCDDPLSYEFPKKKKLSWPNDMLFIFELMLTSSVSTEKKMIKLKGL